MKWPVRFFWWSFATLGMIGATVALARWQPILLILLLLPLKLILAKYFSSNWTPPKLQNAWSYQQRNPDAGRWLDPPVAELDKTTIGKLLTSRATRDPRVHVVPGRASPPSTDALYDPELDG